MKTKSFFSVAIAALVTFTSCSKDEHFNNTKDGETTRVVLNVEQASGLTKGVGNSISGHTVEFTDGYIVFANSSNIATDVFRIVSGTPGDGEVKIGNEIEFNEVSGQSRSVYILGNAGSLDIVAGSTNMEDLVSQATITAISQTDNVNTSTLKNVTLYGKTTSNINHTLNPSTASVKVAPISSRIEIDKFTGSGDVTGYKIEGIFINNFYKTITYSGELNTASGNDKFYLGKVDEPKFTTNGDPVYSATDAGYFYNEDKTNGLAPVNSLICKPGSGVWAYNVPAPKSGEFPHIVIRLSADVTGSNPGETYWMTVTKFIYDGGTNNGNDVLTFEPGKIYKITNFIFDETNLDVAPEMKSVSAKVTVELAEWTVETVKPW